VRKPTAVKNLAVALLPLLLTACGKQTDPPSKPSSGPRIVTVAQSGAADVIGTDHVALQRGANLLRPGDTLQIGPGTYEMRNSLFIPSKTTVRGTSGQTILMKSDGVESPLVEDGDYGESQVRVANPEKWRPGMGASVSDEALDSGWDISVSTVTAVEGNLLHIRPMTLRDYNVEEKHARVRNTFPILCAVETEGVVLESLIVSGKRATSPT
jgi:hypothetical protein